MTVAENIFQNLITLSVLIILGLIIYCKSTGRTLYDILKSMKDIFNEGAEESVQVVQGGFEDIR